MASTFANATVLTCLFLIPGLDYDYMSCGAPKRLELQKRTLFGRRVVDDYCGGNYWGDQPINNAFGISVD